MANKIEISVEQALESKEPDDVKVKMVLQALYYLLRKHHPFPEVPYTPPPLPPVPTLSKPSFKTSFDYTHLPRCVSHQRAEHVVKELGKVLFWDDTHRVTYKGKTIKDSNIIDLVSYLARRTSSIKKPSWYSKVSKAVRLLNLHEKRRKKKKVSWEDYGSV